MKKWKKIVVSMLGAISIPAILYSLIWAFVNISWFRWVGFIALMSLLLVATAYLIYTELP